MIPTKRHQPLMFNWLNITPGFTSVVVGQYMLTCTLRKGAWVWEISRQRPTLVKLTLRKGAWVWEISRQRPTLVKLLNNQNTITEPVAHSRENGYRRLHTAQYQCEQFYHRNYGEKAV